MSPAVLRKGMTKILQNCAFVSYASTFMHLQPRLTQFFAFFLQTRRLSRTSFSLQHFLLTINCIVPRVEGTPQLRKHPVFVNLFSLLPFSLNVYCSHILLTFMTFDCGNQLITQNEYGNDQIQT
jgi:hypothetical protein